MSDIPPSAKKAGLHLKRPCLLVTDLARSLQLYQDILGFHLDYVGEASASSYLYQVFSLPSQAQLKFAALSTAHEPRALALTEVKQVNLPPLPPSPRGATVIQVDEITAKVDRMRALGLRIVDPSYFTAPPNLSFTEQGVYDFDGHLIVLYETTVLATAAVQQA